MSATETVVTVLCRKRTKIFVVRCFDYNLKGGGLGQRLGRGALWVREFFRSQNLLSIRHKSFRSLMSMSLNVLVTNYVCHERLLSRSIRHQKLTITKRLSPYVLEPWELKKIYEDTNISTEKLGPLGNSATTQSSGDKSMDYGIIKKTCS